MATFSAVNLIATRRSLHEYIQWIRYKLLNVETMNTIFLSYHSFPFCIQLWSRTDGNGDGKMCIWTLRLDSQGQLKSGVGEVKERMTSLNFKFSQN
jgi:hypothetical protein